MNAPPVASARVYGAQVHSLTLRYMAVKGAMYAAIGLSWVIQPSPGRLAGLKWLEFVRPEMIGGMLIFAGMLAMITSLIPRHPIWRQAGWTGLIAAPMLIGFYFFVAWVLHFVPGAEGGTGRSIATTLSYAAFAASAYIMARVYTVTLPTLTTKPAKGT